MSDLTTARRYRVRVRRTRREIALSRLCATMPHSACFSSLSAIFWVNDVNIRFPEREKLLPRQNRLERAASSATADGPTRTSSSSNPRGISVSLLDPSPLRRTVGGCWLSDLFVVSTVISRGAGGTAWKDPAGGEKMGGGVEVATLVKLKTEISDEITPRLCWGETYML